MRFAAPGMFWLFWVVPLLAAFFIYAYRKKSRTLARFAQVDMLKRMTEGISRGRQALQGRSCCCWWPSSPCWPWRARSSAPRWN